MFRSMDRGYTHLLRLKGLGEAVIGIQGRRRGHHRRNPVQVKVVGTGGRPDVRTVGRVDEKLRRRQPGRILRA